MLSGSSPFQYSFESSSLEQIASFYYNHLNLNKSTGILNITQALASLESYNFVIIVTNAISTTNLSVIIQVPPSYNATVIWKYSNQYVSASITTTLEYSGSATIPYIPIKIWIDDTISTVLTSDSQGQFSGVYQLSNNFFGRQLEIAASHPVFMLSPIAQDVVFVEYIRISFSQWIYWIYAAYPVTLTEFVTIQNQGNFDLINVTINLTYNSQCIQYYSFFPSVINILPASSSINVSLLILLNCLISNEYMTFSVHESRLFTLASSAFILNSQWSCRTRNNCNNYGSCIDNETCSCTNSYSGDSCQQCASNLFAYPSCVQCPVCVRGQARCNSSVAICDCIDNIRIYGSLCQYCQQGYYGPNCEAIPIVFSLSPTSGLELTNETFVTLTGNNFRNVSSFCLLDDENQTISISAAFINTQQMVCVFNSHPAESIRVRLVQNNSVVLSANILIYRYLPSCPLSGCNQGECVMGNCRCRYPYFGKNCSSLPIPPRLMSIPNLTLVEMSSLSFNLSQYLIQGDLPLAWLFIGNVPNGLSIDSLTSLLPWTSAIASLTDYIITVNVLQNSTGVISQQTFSISVPLTYNVSVQFRQSHQILTHSITRLAIIGQINIFDNRTISSQNRIANVWIMIHNVRRYLSTINIPNGSNTFTVYYTPLTNEYGTLCVGGQHPADQLNNIPQDYLTLLGLIVQILITDRIEMKAGDIYMNSFTSAAFVSNPSNYTIDNLTLSLISPQEIVPFYNISSSNCSLKTIFPFTTCSIDFNIQFNQSGSGYLAFTLSNEIITPAILTFPIHVIVDRAEFELNPSSSNFIVSRNSQQTLVITINNTGSFRLGPLVILLPDQTYIYLITPNISTIEKYGNASFTLAIQISDSAPLSIFTLRGIIRDNTYLITHSFTIQLTIVGSNETLFDLNIVCKDEFSYFGNNLLNLANVTITLVNYDLNVKYVFQSNETGQATISLVAGTYEISAQARNHSSYRNAVTVDRNMASNNEFLIFLQRILVSYTFKVTQVSVDQTYIITLDAQFVAYVPAPVLVVSPTTIDLNELETNQGIAQLDFTFTNYGLIRLNDLQLSLPISHPFLRFSVQQLPIGNIEANSSIIVSLAIEHLNVSRSNRTTETICSLIIPFFGFYICDTKHFVGGVILFTKLGCGVGDFWGDGGYGGGLIEGTITYYPPIKLVELSCDNCITSILNCIISWTPYASITRTAIDISE
ncbi:unnamed protein product [Rotaria sp. Silwood1]|nr:unnamed protein product [Rotaria sp. Silwood1]CAF4909193.1 unnamed protein product [Rotaria sp. Silwood1]